MNSALVRSRIEALLTDLQKQRGVKLWLELFITITVHNFRDFLFPPHMWRAVRVAF